MGRVFNRELGFVIAVVSIASMAMSILQPVLSLYLASLGISPATIGLMFSLAMVGMIFGESGGGWLADKIGVRIPFGIGTFINGLVVMLFLVASNIPFIFGVFLLWGVVRATVYGPGRGYIGTKVPAARRATWLAVYGASMAVTRSIGSFIGGWVAEHLGFTWNFYIAGSIVIAAGLLVVFGLNKIPLINPAAPSHPSTAENNAPIKAPYRSRPFLTQCGVAVLSWIPIGIIGPLVPLLAADKAGVKETEIGLLFTITALTSAAIQIPLGRLSDVLNKKAMMITGLGIVAVGFIGIAYANNYGWLLGGLLIESIGTSLFGPGAVALLSETVPGYWQNTAMGVYGGCEDTGVVIGSALSGIAWEAFGPKATFLLIGGAPSILAAIVILTLVKYRHVKPA